MGQIHGSLITENLNKYFTQLLEDEELIRDRQFHELMKVYMAASLIRDRRACPFCNGRLHIRLKGFFKTKTFSMHCSKCGLKAYIIHTSRIGDYLEARYGRRIPESVALELAWKCSSILSVMIENFLNNKWCPCCGTELNLKLMLPETKLSCTKCGVRITINSENVPNFDDYLLVRWVVLSLYRNRLGA